MSWSWCQKGKDYKKKKQPKTLAIYNWSFIPQNDKKNHNNGETLKTLSLKCIKTQ